MRHLIYLGMLFLTVLAVLALSAPQLRQYAGWLCFLWGVGFLWAVAEARR